MQAIYIFWLRQVKRYIRSTPRIVGAVGQPLLFLVALGFGLGPALQGSGLGVSYIQYLVPGIIGLALLFTSMFNGMELIEDRRFGFLKETLVAPVSRFSIILGKTLGGATVATMQGFLVFLLSFIFGFKLVTPVLLPLFVVAMFLISLLFTALGIAIATQLEDTQSFPLIINFVIFPLFFLSGALFPLKNLPLGLEIAVTLNPLTYGVDALRATLIGIHTYPIVLNLSIVIGLARVVLATGGYLFSKIRL